MAMNNEQMVLRLVPRLFNRLGIRQYYLDGMVQLRADAWVLEKLLDARLPRVKEAFKRNGLELMFVCSKWFLCLFATSLPPKTLLRVWDCMLCEGAEVIFRVAVALLNFQADQISR